MGSHCVPELPRPLATPFSKYAVCLWPFLPLLLHGWLMVTVLFLPVAMTPPQHPCPLSPDMPIYLIIIGPSSLGFLSVTRVYLLIAPYAHSVIPKASNISHLGLPSSFTRGLQGSGVDWCNFFILKRFHTVSNFFSKVARVQIQAVRVTSTMLLGSKSTFTYDTVGVRVAGPQWPKLKINSSCLHRVQE